MYNFVNITNRKMEHPVSLIQVQTGPNTVREETSIPNRTNRQVIQTKKKSEKLQN
jgi:hypothetical protein